MVNKLCAIALTALSGCISGAEPQPTIIDSRCSEQPIGRSELVEGYDPAGQNSLDFLIYPAPWGGWGRKTHIV